jgi:peroxiredoxin Q/BCP
VNDLLDYELPNVGAGPDPLDLASVATEHEYLLLFFQRDYHCTNCRKQVQTVGDRYPAVRDRGDEVVSIVPEPPDRLRDWQADYQLPYPLCADPEATVADAFDQPVRFGLLGNLSDFLGRMPKAVLFDCRTDEWRIAYSHAGSSTWDRPDLDAILERIDSANPG